jgi:hypothetical protein
MNAKPLAVGLIATLTHLAQAAPVTDESSWNETYRVSATAPRLIIRNVWGNVRVRAGAAGEITVRVEERRSAPSRELFEQSRQQLYLDVQADAAGVELWVGGQDRDKWSFDHCRGCRVDYQFDVSVPPGTQVDVSTVDDGAIDVAGASGVVSANNVNGPVAVSNLNDCGEIESIKGTVELAFAQSPSRNCSIKTINGDIALTIPPAAGLDVALSIAHGRIDSEFDLDPLALPAKVETTRRNGQYIYHVAQAAGVRLGAGGATFDIASLNGDVRIHKGK